MDKFVIDCRKRVPLETLRDDLSVYLKILKSAMIELINKDYADFVNLSTNLVCHLCIILFCVDLWMRIYIRFAWMDHVCVGMCVCVCVCVCMRERESRHMYACTHKSACTHTHMHARTHKDWQVSVCPFKTSRFDTWVMRKKEKREEGKLSISLK